MNKLTCLALCLALVSLLPALNVDLNTAGSYARINRSDPTGIELSINLGSISIGSGGNILLPAELKQFAKSDAVPTLLFHLALPSTGNFQATISERQCHSGIPTPQGYASPSATVSIGKPYWMRDIRGVDVSCQPIHSLDGELLVADSISICLTMQYTDDSCSGGSVPTRLNPYWLDIYRQHFYNFSYRYQDIAEYGSLAVICPPAGYEPQTGLFKDLIQPWVDWKNQQGIPTTVYTTAQAGSTFEDIQSFIQNLYNNDPQLTFVQLVGDYAQVPCKVATLYGNTGGMDAYYTLLQGDDYYPDIFVGRFSAETAAELYTQVARSVAYEKATTSGPWLSRAAGVCSSNPPLPGDDDEHNWEHLDNIRALLLDYGYTSVDRIYANEGANTQDLIASMNEGKSLVNYCGEGYPDHWVEPEFGIGDAAGLTNTDMLPFVHVVSCWTGQFYNGTCLAEALLRSRNGTATQARGAIAVYASAPEQGIAPPMEAQDHAMDLLVADTKHSIGGICYNGACSMIDAYGEYGAYNFLAWNLFGDASLQLRTKPAELIDAILPVALSETFSSLDIDAGGPDILVALSRDNQCVVSAFSGADGMAHLDIQPEPCSGEDYLLTLTGFDRVPIQKALHCYPSNLYPALEMELLPSDQFIEPEVEIIKTLRITNHGPGTANAVSLSLVADYQNIIPMQNFRHWAHIDPGEVLETQLTYRIPAGAQDLSSVGYRIILTPDTGVMHCTDVVHAPEIILDKVYRTPQPNWINPGDTFGLVYKLRNTGSAKLRNLHGELNSSSGNLLVTQQDGRHLDIDPGAADSLVFGVQVDPSCPEYTTVNSELLLMADNTVEDMYHQWIVTDRARTVESFETQDLQAFPWVYISDHWGFSVHSLDGVASLVSQPTTAESVWLSISFQCRQAGVLRFRYDLYRNPGCQDAWNLWVNGSPMPNLEDNNYWKSQNINLAEGFYTLRWMGTRDPALDSFGSTFWLDMVDFPPGTLFDNALLQSDISQADITLAPGEIRSLPIQLQSMDGKEIEYSAVLRHADSPTRTDNGIRLECNKTSFHPGTEEVFLITLYNQDPAHSIREVGIDLPESVIASQAGNFSMPGAVSVPFTGSVGSMSYLHWFSDDGSLADSLRSGIRLAMDANLSRLEMPYVIHTVDTEGQTRSFEGSIELTRWDYQPESVILMEDQGWVSDTRTATLSLRANQNLLQGTSTAYLLDIYYNGSNKLSIPINIAYNSDPPGFYDVPRLSVYPNPCRSTTTLAYGIPANGKALLEVYNIRGQKVRTLVDTPLDKGYYRTIWDARDDHGHLVSDGIYFCRLKAANGQRTVIRCVVLR